MKSKQNISKKDLIIKIILIVIIIILLIHNCSILKNNKKSKKTSPTGNVNIIEIICDKDDTCVVKNDKDNTQNNLSTNENKNSNSLDNNINNSNNNEPDNEVINKKSEETGLVIEDKTISWQKTTQAKIFSNSMYDLHDKIAPESSNTYQFIVKNGTNYTINYIINFIETNPYNINMKYKLKKNDTYVIDHYVSASELNQTGITLNPKKNDTYYLEWKWISSSNDTQIGETINAKYELKIEVKAESNNV